MRDQILKQIDKIHADNGKVVDIMNEGKYDISVAKEMLNVNANKIEMLKEKLKTIRL